MVLFALGGRPEATVGTAKGQQYCPFCKVICVTPIAHDVVALIVCGWGAVCGGASYERTCWLQDKTGIVGKAFLLQIGGAINDEQECLLY